MRTLLIVSAFLVSCANSFVGGSPARILTPALAPTPVFTAPESSPPTPDNTTTPAPPSPLGTLSTSSPVIDPRLSPNVENALARLAACCPSGHALVRQYALSFRPIEGGYNRSSPEERAVLISTNALELSGYSDNAEEFWLLLVITHEARHNWQFEQRPDMHSNRAAMEREAYRYELQVLEECSGTVRDRNDLMLIRRTLTNWAANPPLE